MRLVGWSCVAVVCGRKHLGRRPARERQWNVAARMCADRSYIHATLDALVATFFATRRGGSVLVALDANDLQSRLGERFLDLSTQTGRRAAQLGAHSTADNYAARTLEVLLHTESVASATCLDTSIVRSSSL